MEKYASGNQIPEGIKLKTYKDFFFQLEIPTISKLDDCILINFVVRYKSGSEEQLFLTACRIKDKLANENFRRWEGLNIPRDSSRKKISIDVPIKTRNFLMRDSVLKLYFLATDERKYEVCYQMHSASKLQFLYVMCSSMTDAEKKAVSALQKEAVKKKSEGTGQKKLQAPEAEKADETDERDQREAISLTPTLEEYKNAVFREMYFLRDNGGRKYRVSNGRQLSSTNGNYVYYFDIEAEVYLADSASVILTVRNEREEGSVLVCEDFQLIIVIERDLGKTIDSAFISVEPWKLLQKLNEKLISISESDRLAVKLLEEGPALAGRESYKKIKRGQKAAFDRAVREDITVIWGPPGTGKTHTISEIAIHFYKQGRSVLIVSHSNISVDGVIHKIAELMEARGMKKDLTSGKILRYGYVRDEQLSANPHVVSFNYALSHDPAAKAETERLRREKEKLTKSSSPYNEQRVRIERDLKKIRMQLRREESYYAEHAQVLATTISKVISDKLFDGKKYDVVLFDEVSMAYVPQLLCAASYAKEHFICVGDFRQLAPIVQSDAKKILSKDIFSYLKISVGENIYYHPWLVLLDEQRRMHPDISRFPNRFVYHSLLKDHDSVKTNRNQIVYSDPFNGHAMNLIDLSGTYCAAGKNSDNSRFNILSAVVSFSAALTVSETGKMEPGIITPYAAQTRLIRAMIQDNQGKNTSTQISCSTVHQFQGSERDVIIFDAVESYPGLRAGWLMSKNDNNSVVRLINVAVTRARGKLIAVANGTFWENKFSESNHIFYKLLNHLKKEGYVTAHKDRSLESYLAAMPVGKNIKYYRTPDESLADFKKDIDRAGEKIVISIPDGELNAETSDEIFQCIRNAHDDGIRILMKSNDYKKLPEKWKRFCWGSEDAFFPLILIDDSVIWYGLPHSKGTFHDGDFGYMTVCHTIFRIRGTRTIEMIKSLTGLEERVVDKERKALIEKSSKYAGSEEDEEGKSAAGLGRFIEENEKCPECREPMKLTKSKKNKCYLKCSTCTRIAYLTPEVTNWYITREQVRCPIHHCEIYAALGPYGIYIQCEHGHYLKPDEI